MEDNWKVKLKDVMSDYTEPTPDGLFEDIMTVCETKSGRRRRNVIFILSGMAAAAILALALIPGGLSLPVSSPADSMVVENLTETLPVRRQEAPEFSGIMNPVIPAAGEIHDHDIRKDIREKPAATKPDMPGQTHPEQTEDTGRAVSVAPARESTDKRTDSEIQQNAYDWQDLLLADAGKPRKKKKPSLSVFASGFSPGGSRHSGYSDAVNAVAAAAPMRYGDNSLAGILMFNMTREVSTESSHYLPVKAGISVSYDFLPRWSVGSGLTYSWLLSKSKTGSESYYLDSRQVLHYLGIPVSIGYRFWDNRWIQAYVCAGGMVEKCVGGSIRTDYVYDNDSRDSGKEKISDKPLYWSVGAAAGLQFNLSESAGIYLEPGVSYHFRNGSSLETVYSEHPLNFSLNLGLRFSFN